MAITYGFYDSINHDRKYSAEQLSSLFDGLITDGVFSSIGNKFTTVPGGGMKVMVKSGKAWFNNTWTINDADYLLDISPADVTMSRIDTVVLIVDTNESVRANSLGIVQGTPATNPQKPQLLNTGKYHQYPLAYVRVPGSATEIKATNIEIAVGMSVCPYVTGMVQQASIEDLFNQWTAEFREWFGDKNTEVDTWLQETEAEFNEWFQYIQSVLSEDVVGNLQVQIDQRVKTADKATATEAQTGTNDTKWMTPAKVTALLDYRKASTAEAQAGTNDTKWMTPLKVKQAMTSNKMNVGEYLFTTEDPGSNYIKCDGSGITRERALNNQILKNLCITNLGEYPTVKEIFNEDIGTYVLGNWGASGSSLYVVAAAGGGTDSSNVAMVCMTLSGSSNNYTCSLISLDSKGSVISQQQVSGLENNILYEPRVLYCGNGYFKAVMSTYKNESIHHIGTVNPSGSVTGFTTAYSGYWYAYSASYVESFNDIVSIYSTSESESTRSTYHVLVGSYNRTINSGSVPSMPLWSCIKDGYAYILGNSSNSSTSSVGIYSLNISSSNVTSNTISGSLLATIPRNNTTQYNRPYYSSIELDDCILLFVSYSDSMYGGNYLKLCYKLQNGTASLIYNVTDGYSFVDIAPTFAIGNDILYNNTMTYVWRLNSEKTSISYSSSPSFIVQDTNLRQIYKLFMSTSISYAKNFYNKWNNMDSVKSKYICFLASYDSYYYELLIIPRYRLPSIPKSYRLSPYLRIS